MTLSNPPTINNNLPLFPQRYLTESIINLRWTDPITKEHAPKVMRELTQNCQNFLAANPTSSLATGLRMLLMGIQALGLKQI